MSTNHSNLTSQDTLSPVQFDSSTRNKTLVILCTSSTHSSPTHPILILPPHFSPSLYAPIHSPPIPTLDPSSPLPHRSPKPLPPRPGYLHSRTKEIEVEDCGTVKAEDGCQVDVESESSSSLERSGPFLGRSSLRMRYRRWVRSFVPVEKKTCQLSLLIYS